MSDAFDDWVPLLVTGIPRVVTARRGHSGLRSACEGPVCSRPRRRQPVTGPLGPEYLSQKDSVMHRFSRPEGRVRPMVVAAFLALATLYAAVPATVGAEVRDAAADSPSLDAGSAPPRDQLLAERVSARWDAMMARDLEKVYEYLSPAYRDLYPLNHLQRMTGTSVQWIAMEIDAISIEGDRADVVVSLEYKLSLPPAAGFSIGDEFGVLTKQIEEVWVWTDEEWWYVNPYSGRL